MSAKFFDSEDVVCDSDRYRSVARLDIDETTDRRHPEASPP